MVDVSFIRSIPNSNKCMIAKIEVDSNSNKFIIAKIEVDSNSNKFMIAKIEVNSNSNKFMIAKIEVDSSSNTFRSIIKSSTSDPQPSLLSKVFLLFQYFFIWGHIRKFSREPWSSDPPPSLFSQSLNFWKFYFFESTPYEQMFECWFLIFETLL